MKHQSVQNKQVQIQKGLSLVKKQEKERKKRINKRRENRIYKKTKPNIEHLIKNGEVYELYNITVKILDSYKEGGI